MPEIAIAIVEDDSEIGSNLAQKLVHLGHKVNLYQDAEDFFSAIEIAPSRFKIVIADRFVGQDDLVTSQFPKACRYYGCYSKLILYSNDRISALPLNEISQYEYILTKAEKIDWNSVIQKCL